MNFQSLKWMIESIIKSFKCSECQSIINDSNIDMIWAAWSTINIDIVCSNCWKHSMVKTEILAIDLSKKWLLAENIEKLKESLNNVKWRINTNETKINDELIIWLNKDLKKEKLNVSDLLWE